MENFVQKRLEICKKCALCKSTEFGLKCDDRKWLDKVNNIASFFKKEGWIRGCGCLLSYRAAKPSSHCVAGKW